MKEIISEIKQFLIHHEPSNKIMGLARSLLAFSSLITFLFNDINLLIPAEHIAVVNKNSLIIKGNFFLLFGHENMHVAKVVAIGILILVISGYFIQFTSILHFWIAASFNKITFLDAGGDKTAMLLSLLLIPVCLFDSRRNHWDKPVTFNKNHNLVKNLAIIFIKFQVAYIYFDSAWDKLFVKEWQNGKVIYYWFTHPFYGLSKSARDLVEPVLSNMILLKTIAYGTILLEGLIAIGIIFSAKTRLRLIFAGLVFHFGIIIVHGLFSFFFVMAAALILYLYPEKEWRLK